MPLPLRQRRRRLERRCGSGWSLRRRRRQRARAVATGLCAPWPLPPRCAVARLPRTTRRSPQTPCATAPSEASVGGATKPTPYVAWHYLSAAVAQDKAGQCTLLRCIQLLGRANIHPRRARARPRRAQRWTPRARRRRGARCSLQNAGALSAAVARAAHVPARGVHAEPVCAHAPRSLRAAARLTLSQPEGRRRGPLLCERTALLLCGGRALLDVGCRSNWRKPNGAAPCFFFFFFYPAGPASESALRSLQRHRFIRCAEWSSPLFPFKRARGAARIHAFFASASASTRWPPCGRRKADWIEATGPT